MHAKTEIVTADQSLKWQSPNTTDFIFATLSGAIVSTTPVMGNDHPSSELGKAPIQPALSVRLARLKPLLVLRFYYSLGTNELELYTSLITKD